MTEHASTEDEADAAEIDLALFINPNKPFGPVASEDFEDHELRDALFDKENRAYERLSRRDPAFVIGRRGAGKTSFLHALTADRSTLDVEVNTSIAIAVVQNLLSELDERGEVYFTEQIANLWEAALWHPLFLALVKDGSAIARSDDPRFDKVRVYLHDLVDGDPAYIAERDILGLFCERFAEESLKRKTLVHNPMSIKIGTVSLAETKGNAVDLLAEAGVQPVLLMDSIEDFAKVLSRHKENISGLFMLVGRSAKPKADVRIRFSFPAELWPHLNTLAENPLKDLGSYIILNWSAREIIKIAAHRYMLYLQHFHPDFLRTNRDLARLNPEVVRDALRLLRAVLPPKVVGPLGVEEDAIAYVLRHTQLLPRHLLRLLNAIWEKEQQTAGSIKVTSASVVAGVKEVENRIIMEICKAYSLVHPWANEVCRTVLPNLPRRFSDPDLHRAYNHFGKGALKRAWEHEDQRWVAIQRYGSYSSGGPDMKYADFKAMLAEIGCLGRLRNETGSYVVADFDYTVPGKLEMRESDEMCVHPLFSGVYQSAADDGDDVRVVYPYGTDPEIDHRQLKPVRN